LQGGIQLFDETQQIRGIPIDKKDKKDRRTTHSGGGVFADFTKRIRVGYGER
jgi:hypothetical protein